MFVGFYAAILIFLQINVKLGSAQGSLKFGDLCNVTDQCSDHRYECLLSEENKTRCLCDRFHAWMGDNEGCVQIFNATEIMNRTVSVTDNIKRLEDEINFIMRAQLGAGLFVFVMVVVACLAISIFCVYTHVKDRRIKKAMEEESRLNQNPDPRSLFYYRQG